MASGTTCHRRTSCTSDRISPPEPAIQPRLDPKSIHTPP